MRHFGVLFSPYTTHMKCEDSHRDTSEIFLDRLNPMETTHSIHCAHSKFTECTILSELSLASQNPSNVVTGLLYSSRVVVGFSGYYTTTLLTDSWVTTLLIDYYGS